MVLPELQVLRRPLSRSFPQWIDSVEDAVQEVHLVGLQRRPEPSLAWARTVAWRQLRALHRADQSRRRWSLPASEGVADTEARLDARRALERLVELAPVAARRFARRCPETLEAALRLRFTGLSDTEVAAETGMRREVINRAMQWLRGRVWPATA